MTQNSSDYSSRTARSLDYCEKLRNQLENGLITFPEYAYNVTLAMILVPDESIEGAVELIPSDVVDQYQDYLRTSLEPVVYMPCPMPFLAGGVSERDIEEKKHQLKHKYMRLHQLVKDKIRPV